MDVSDRRRNGHTWPYALGGAVLLFAIVVFGYAGGYEGGDAVLVLGPFAAVVGGCVGAAVGRLINDRHRER